MENNKNIKYKVRLALLNEIYTPSLAFAGIGGNAIAATMLVAILFQYISFDHIIGWYFPMLLLLSLRAYSIVVFHKKHHENLIAWETVYQIGILFTGISWGAVTYIFGSEFDSNSALFFDKSSFYMFILSLLLGVSAAAVAILGVIKKIFATLVLPMFSMLSYDFWLLNTNESKIISMMILFGMLYMLYTASKHSNKSSEIIFSGFEIKRTQSEIINRLAKAGEFKDNDTGAHVNRMSYSSYLLALECGLSNDDAKQLLLAAPMHDIGKIGIPDSILLKKGKLSKKEWEIMKKHPSIGADILGGSNSELLNLATVIAESHHEKWDGSGYPKGLEKLSIPLEGRIVAISDVFDALTSKRPYKKAWSKEDAVSFIKSESDKHFDPDLVVKFLSILPKVVEYNEQNQEFIN